MPAGRPGVRRAQPYNPLRARVWPSSIVWPGRVREYQYESYVAERSANEIRVRAAYETLKYDDTGYDIRDTSSEVRTGSTR